MEFHEALRVRLSPTVEEFVIFEAGNGVSKGAGDVFVSGVVELVTGIVGGVVGVVALVGGFVVLVRCGHVPSVHDGSTWGQGTRTYLLKGWFEGRVE